MHVSGLCSILALSCLFIVSSLAANTAGPNDEKQTTLQLKKVVQQTQNSQSLETQIPRTPEEFQPPLETNTGMREKIASDGLTNDLENAKPSTIEAGEETDPDADSPSSYEVAYTNALRYFEERGLDDLVPFTCEGKQYWVATSLNSAGEQVIFPEPTQHNEDFWMYAWEASIRHAVILDRAKTSATRSGEGDSVPDVD